jgi:hypothetical protein
MSNSFPTIAYNSAPAQAPWSDTPPGGGGFDPIDAARTAYCAAQEQVWRREAVEAAAWATYHSVGEGWALVHNPAMYPTWQAADTALVQAKATLLVAETAYKTAVLARSEGR